MTTISHPCFAGGKTLLAIIFAIFLAVVFRAPGAEAAVYQAAEDDTYDEATIVSAATDFLGEGAEGIAKAIEGLFKRYGRPNGYITGSEAGGGLVVGLRYGGGDFQHKIEGVRPVHWTGPSIGFDAGADAVKVFGLVYNVYDTEEIYRRIPAIEGSFYYVGGLGISAYTTGEMTIALVRVGVGLRAQASLGYLKLTKKRTLLPF